MRIGLIGAGNMASALARGWGDPVLVSDPAPGRAKALAEAVGGTAMKSSAEMARRCDIVILCHKPAQLKEVAMELDGAASGVVSILGGVTLAQLEEAYPNTPLMRMLPSVPVEVSAGVTCHARDPSADPGMEEAVLNLFRRVGPVVTVEESQIDVAMGVMSCAPAYMALVAEAQVDAAVRAGLPADLAGELVVATMAGTAALLGQRNMDTLAVRRSVTSPGGITARGLAALERNGLRVAFDDAMQAVLA